MNNIEQYDFLTDLLEQVLHYAKIPKLQVERLVGPIITLFINEVMNEVEGTHLAGEDAIKLVGPEWPLKISGGFQSTNADWLMIQPNRLKVFLVELKTDFSSKKDIQLDRYIEVQNRVRQESASFLFDDVEEIKKRSNKKNKYEHLLYNAVNAKSIAHKCYDTKIIYIVPRNLKKLYKKHDISCLSFDDLPKEIDSIKNEVWKRVRDTLIKLDDIGESENKVDGERQPLTKGELLVEISLRLRRDYPNRIPKRIWFGRLGEGSFPNYQIEFEDGFVQPFYNSGREYNRFSQFKTFNLDGPYLWNELLTNHK